MKKKYKIALTILLFLAAGALAIYYIFTKNIAVLEPKGMIGVKEKDLIITASLLMMIVVIPVFILTAFFAWRYSEKNGKGKHAPEWEHNYIAEYCWWGVPMVIIAVLAVICWKSSHELNPFRPIENGTKPLTIQVVALEWKWLFIYPEQGIATINYVQFPEKTPINFEITADAPMNSFWIPQLGGQIYAMPAMRTKLHLISNEVGTFRGASANLSGSGFAGMTFQAEASTEGDFNQWVQRVSGSSNVLGVSQYDQLVIPSQYDPVAYYRLGKSDLFDWIVMKYAPPQQKR